MLIARISKKGARLLELTQKAVDLYKKQKTMEKRRILDLLFSNWTARFFKTRALAAEAVNGGKVEVNGDRPKPSRVVRIGDELNIRRGPYGGTIAVKQVSRLRGPAIHAQALYEETVESVRKREAAIAQLKLERPPEFDSAGRPSKKDRRAIAKTKRGW